MLFLSKKQRRTLTSLCDTIVPGCADDGLGDSASEMGVVKLAEKALCERDDVGTQRQLQLLLNLLNTRSFNWIIARQWGRFSELSLQGQTNVLSGLASSRFNLLRGAFHGIKQLVAFLAYSHYPPLGSNPSWRRLGYHGRALTPEPTGERLPTIIPNGCREYECDALVIGSGAGGAVVAAELAQAGYDVIIAEKGKYFSNADFPATELAGMRDLYDGRGSRTTVNRGMVVLAGSTLGGGTTVNWMTSLDPPESLLQEWRSQHGFHAATSRDFASSLEFVKRRINVTTDESCANPQNELIERGCKALGYHFSVIPRNVSDCKRCDFCGFGCRHGAKQDTRCTFLADAAERGSRIMVQATAMEVLHRKGVATGARFIVTTEPGEQHEISVRSQVVIVAAGAIHTPALLRKSGLSNKHIGANLHLHPCGAVYARYPEKMNSWAGAPQTRICDEFANLDGAGYGVRLEASPAHPGLWALALPWRSGHHHRQLMRDLPRIANTIVLTRDRYSGQIKLDRRGRPRLHYKLHPYDAQHLSIGVEKALRVHRAAGADRVFGPTNEALSFAHGTDVDFEAYLRRVQGLGIRPNHFGLFCAHQLSSCRIGPGPSQGAISPEGETFEVTNLYVADGSALPSASGVNPMITIMTTAHHIAQHVKVRLAAVVGASQPQTRVRRVAS